LLRINKVIEQGVLKSSGWVRKDDIEIAGEGQIRTDEDPVKPFPGMAA
jgi:hypothetical protein